MRRSPARRLFLGEGVDDGLIAQSSGSNTIGDGLYLGFEAGRTGTYTLTGGSLSAIDAFVGYDGIGLFTQSGGTNTIASTLYLGRFTTGNGTYNLSGTGSLEANNEYIGYSGNGTFTQTGGTNTVNSNLFLAISSGTSGVYKISSGALSVTSRILGGSGTSTLVIDGGTVSVGGSVVVDYWILGQDAASNASYTNSSEADQAKIDFDIGVAGTGAYTLTGGSLTVDGQLRLGVAGAGAGTFTQSGGTATAASLSVGQEGDGTVNHSAGTLDVGTTLHVGEAGGGRGGYNLSGTGELTIAGDLALAQATGSEGTFRMSGGTLNVTGDIAGGSGVSTFVLDGGTVNLSGTASVSDIIIGRDPLSSGTVTTSASFTATNDFIVGEFGDMNWTQTGGTIIVGRYMELAKEAGSSTVYTLQGGSLFVGDNFIIHAGGTLNIASAAVSIRAGGTDFVIEDGGVVNAVAGASIVFTGTNFINQSTDAADVAGLANITLTFEGGAAVIDTFEVGGYGFNISTLVIGGMQIGQIQLVDLFDNQLDGPANEFLFVKNLVVNAGSSLDLNGITLYYETLDNQGDIITTGGGSLTAVPEPSTLLLLGASLTLLVLSPGYIIGPSRFRLRRQPASAGCPITSTGSRLSRGLPHFIRGTEH